MGPQQRLDSALRSHVTVANGRLRILAFRRINRAAFLQAKKRFRVERQHYFHVIRE